MNQDQLINLIQSVGKIGGGIAAGYGASTANLYAAVIGLLVAGVGFYYSHKSNATPPAAPTPTPK